MFHSVTGSGLKSIRRIRGLGFRLGFGFMLGKSPVEDCYANTAQILSDIYLTHGCILFVFKSGTTRFSKEK